MKRKPDQRLDELFHAVYMAQWAQGTDRAQVPEIDPILPTVGIMDWVGEVHRLIEGGTTAMCRVIEAGHVIQLETYDGGEVQLLTFMKRVGVLYPGNREPAHGGTNCQEVLRGLIHRTKYLMNQSEQECDKLSIEDDQRILFDLRSALIGFEVRAARRHNRSLTLENELGSLDGPENKSFCGICGHIGCAGGHE